MAEKQTISDLAAAHVKELLTTQLPVQYVFHNLKHTKRIVKQAGALADAQGLGEDEREMLIIAAWFHDTGYVDGHEEHEEASAARVSAFLVEQEYNQDSIKTIEGCIRATKYPQSPENNLEKLLCDADLSGISLHDHFKIGEVLRSEWETTQNKFYSEPEWLQLQIDFLEGHQYHTEVGRDMYSKGLESNLFKLRARRKKTNKRDFKSDKNIKQTEKKMAKEKDKEKKKEPTRGIETMFRLTSTNHIRLSAIADNKANIMLSINAIIISIVLSTLVPKFDKNVHLILPTLVLVAVCVLSIIYATLSTQPKVNKGRFTKQDIDNKTANLLFFGNFYSMELDEFEEGFNAMMADREFLYGSMTRDLYYLGRVLARKYKYLRVCYSIFMYGLIIAVAAFAYSFMTYTPAI